MGAWTLRTKTDARYDVNLQLFPLSTHLIHLFFCLVLDSPVSRSNISVSRSNITALTKTKLPMDAFVNENGDYPTYSHKIFTVMKFRLIKL